MSPNPVTLVTLSSLSPLSPLSPCHTRHFITLSSISPCHSCHTDTLPSLSPLSLCRPCHPVTPVTLSPLSPCHLVTLSRIFAISWLLYRFFCRMICRSNRHFLHFDEQLTAYHPVFLVTMSLFSLAHSCHPVTLSFLPPCHHVVASIPRTFR